MLYNINLKTLLQGQNIKRINDTEAKNLGYLTVQEISYALKKEEYQKYDFPVYSPQYLLNVANDIGLNIDYDI